MVIFGYIKKEIQAILIACWVCFGGMVLSPKCVWADPSPKMDKPSDLCLWYSKPAQDWMTEALPFGNGRIGGMIFGGVAQEHIQFNENSLWTGDEKNTGEYQNFGDLFITFLDTAETHTVPSDYRRALDLNNAIHKISYTGPNGVKCNREYFCSHPDQVIVLNFSFSKRSSCNALIELKDAHASPTKGEDGSLSFSGTLNNGLQYEARLNVKVKKGKTSIIQRQNGACLKVEKADEMEIYMTAATNYSSDRGKGWREGNPHEKVTAILKEALSKNYGTMKESHIGDYSSLFSRVSVDLGTTTPEILSLPTCARLASCHEHPDPQLETLFFQWGRYLLICSSREGSLPANLQGLWNNSNTPPWRCDYHSNINIEMNYWLAEPANLSECHMPFIDYVLASREARREQTKEHYPGVRGWTYQTENNIFGGASWRWNPPASAWYAQHFWEHYAFTKDHDFLKNTAYPVLKEVCQFWEDHLTQRTDGTLVTPDGWSPEHGPEGEGVAYDQEIIYDLFTNYIESADILGVDREYRNKVNNMRDRLLKPKIGKWGQLQEWEQDIDDPQDHHRHVSQLFGLHPGRQISPLTTPDLAEAAKISLKARGDAGTGWSMAWKINFWARLLDGDHAHAILSRFLTIAGGKGINYNDGGGVYSNLLCAHPPFQIDGNFGYTSGVVEMLLQSHAGFVHLLPALPKAWSIGSFTGLCARGGFEISLSWKDGLLQHATILSLKGSPLKIRYGNQTRDFRLKPGEKIVLTGALTQE